ncbi:MAG: iron-sulfur-binding reductase [Chloroflexi bacterium]|nr:MAG: iron-sulfur-binding reductase [Chloroflexota bacterium]
MTPTREILWNVDTLGKIAIYALLLFPLAFLAFTLARRVRMWRMGRPDDRFGDWSQRARTALVKSLLHGRIIRKGKLYAGIMHLCIYSGFIILLIGTLIVMVEDDLTVPLFGWSFYRGDFYLGYKLAMNFGGLILILGVVMAFLRRTVLKPRYQETAGDDVLLLGMLLLLTVQGFLLQAMRLAVERPSWGEWSFVSYPLSVPMRGISNGTLEFLHQTNWWAHFITTFVFIGYIGYSKMVHAFTGLTNVFFRRMTPVGQLARIDNIEEAETFGIGKLQDLTWAQLLNVDACMHCGRCLEYCPTFNTGKELRPRDLILELAGYSADSGGIFSGEVGEGENAARFRWGSGADRELIGGVVSTAEIWDCTTCGACVEHCPVYIDHVPLIVGMRQNLVLEQNEFPNELAPVFNNLERLSNPYSFAPSQRDEWTRKMQKPVTIMADAAARGEDVEVLFFVGCLGSFDSRNQQTTLALARILQAAGINFAILGKEETCTGDPAKRVGNEYLAQMMAEQTVETLNSYSFKKIVTACPHCFNAIRNEFPQIGGNFDVVHHSELISQLLAEGRLQLDPASALARGKVTYHDPCYLGRYNQVYDAPRSVIAALPGAALTEMKRSRNRSFCCGGGGGRMFMEETRGARINRARVTEAIDTGAEVLAAACPFCMTMFEDGIRGVGAEESFVVKDIAELVASSLRSPSESSNNA